MWNTNGNSSAVLSPGKKKSRRESSIFSSLEKMTVPGKTARNLSSTALRSAGLPLKNSGSLRMWNHFLCKGLEIFIHFGITITFRKNIQVSNLKKKNLKSQFWASSFFQKRKRITSFVTNNKKRVDQTYTDPVRQVRGLHQNPRLHSQQKLLHPSPAHIGEMVCQTHRLESMESIQDFFWEIVVLTVFFFDTVKLKDLRF